MGTAATGSQGNSQGANGTTNKGMGGNGTIESEVTAGNGGSGVVILKYPDTRTITIGAGLTGSTASPSGGF
jgi:hypothetical protein